MNQEIRRPITRSYAKRQQEQQQQQQQAQLTQNQQQQQQSSMNDSQRNEIVEQQIIYNKIIIDEKPSNVVNLLFNSQINCKISSRPIVNLPNKTLTMISDRSQLCDDYLCLMKRLDQSSITINYRNINDCIELISIIKEVEYKLTHFDPNSVNNTSNQPADEFEVENISNDSARIFKMYGGIESFKRILLLNLTINNSNKTKSEEKSFMIKIKCKCIQILNRLVCLPNYGKQLVQECLLRDSDTLLQYLFALLLNKDIRLPACQLIENILLHVPLLNLKNIKNIREILESIDNDGLSCMCKIFAVTISDLDSSDSTKWAAQRAKQKSLTSLNNDQISTLSTHTIRDQNQELLLSVPGFLNRLVQLIKFRDYAVRYNGAPNELEHWMRYIDAALSDDEDDEDDDYATLTASNNNNTFEFNIQLNDNNSLLMDDIRYQPALLAAAKLNNFVHVLYTLSLLLIGKERKRVQKLLAKLKLAPALKSLFDYLIWNCRCEYPQETIANQMRSHICPEVAVKIQFLRLVHSFCDNSEYKRTILSKEEINEILSYNRNAIPSLRSSEECLTVDDKLGCTKDKIGLLSKIVEVIKKEPFSASFRFWLTRAIESFLRGGTTYADQLFLINRELVQDTVRNILTINFSRPKEVLQSCFDMLGELIKFNINGFNIVNTELIGDEKFDMFIRMVNNSLVDSNMFIRSIYLSIDFFQKEQHALNFNIDNYPLLKFFDDFERRIRYVCRLISIINIHNLSQENVSCLNTTLVVLMLANKRQQLANYLKALKIKSLEVVVTNEINTIQNQTVTDPIVNFRELLSFWQNHYLQKDKDCVGLEQNSRIDFKYWKETVELLLNPDVKSPCSLNYYLESNCELNLRNTNKIDELRSD